ncbi:MAG TPA: hypothetical protein DIU15_04640 [Deltaproteobacteria bacterium]|nr:hypothetical protein [Deltaproteobacteria bacterium]HCP45302.1 hypothetical protein [Deltaproteobacteria bacterium]|tara:strand:- start:252 stop:851 length:600 start_codon:yes stop_codon:yes gene_type:complete
MERFEHLSMVVFLILGLGLVRLMTSLGSAMSNNITARTSGREPIRFYWVHGMLVVMVFVGMVVFWWNAYPLNDTTFMADEKWNLFLYLLFLCSPVTYFLMSDMLMPKVSDEQQTDLKKYYYDNHQVLMGLALVLQLFSLLNLVVFFNEAIGSTRCVSRLLLLVVLTPLLFSKNERLHQVVMSLFFAGFVYTLAKYHLYV